MDTYVIDSILQYEEVNMLLILQGSKCGAIVPPLYKDVIVVMILGGSKGTIHHTSRE